jgi:hypothetical protein
MSFLLTRHTLADFRKRGSAQLGDRYAYLVFTKQGADGVGPACERQIPAFTGGSSLFVRLLRTHLFRPRSPQTPATRPRSAHASPNRAESADGFPCILGRMYEFMARALSTHRLHLRRRWEEGLRALPPSSGLAHPDTLVHLMPSTLDRIALALASARHPKQASLPAACRCGMNPLVTFFITAETAMIDTLFGAEPAWIRLTAKQRESGLDCLRSTLRKIADDDIEAFCSLCQMRSESRAPHPRPVPQRAVSARHWGGSVHGRPLAPPP